MILTQHAKDRMANRFSLTDAEMNIFMKQIGRTSGYKLIKKKQDEVREVNIQGKKIQAVISGRKIITLLPATIMQEDEAKEYDFLKKQISKYAAERDRYRCLLKMNIIKAIFGLIADRRNI